MTACEEIVADAPGLAALPPDAPERARAEAHAIACPACAQALTEASRLMRALDAAAPPLAPPETLAAAAQPILRALAVAATVEPAARAPRAPSGLVAAAAAAVACWALPLALARRPLEGGRALVFSLGLAALAAFSAAMTVASGGVVAGGFPVISAILSLMAGEGGGFHVRAGVECAFTELGLAAAAATAVGLVTWRRGTRDPSVLVAAAGGGALAGQAALFVTCAASTELPHLLVFHTGALMLALLLSLPAAQALAAIRASRR